MLKCKQNLVCLEHESSLRYFSHSCLCAAVFKRTGVTFENMWGNRFKQTVLLIHKQRNKTTNQTQNNETNKTPNNNNKEQTTNPEEKKKPKNQFQEIL